MAAKVRRINGVWWVVVHHQGRRRKKRVGKDKRLAEQVAKQIQARLVLGEFEIDGGEMMVEMHIGGTLDDPLATAEMNWSEPRVAGRRLESCSIKASGGLENVNWEPDAAPPPGTSVVASGCNGPSTATRCRAPCSSSVRNVASPRTA